MNTDERRVHARVSVEHPCRMRFDERTLEGTLTQLSVGGARIEMAQRGTASGTPFVLEVDVPGESEPLTIRCETVHEQEAGEAMAAYGVRFLEADGEQRVMVEELLETVLGGPGGGARVHPRVARRIDVSCQTAEEIRAVMCDLSQGGLGLVSPGPLEVGETLTVTVQLRGFPQPLQLSGTVVHVRPEEDHYHAGVRFQDLAPERKGVLRDLIQFLVTDRPKGG